MKEAIRVDLDGKYQEPVIVPDEQAGITPIYAAPKPPDEGEEQTEPEITGYIVAEKVPEGLYMPRWDFSNSEWIEGLSLEELDAIRNAPLPVTINQRVDELESESVQTMLAVAEVYETSMTDNTQREQEGVDTMLGLTEAYDLILQLQTTVATLEGRIAQLEGGAS